MLETHIQGKYVWHKVTDRMLWLELDRSFRFHYYAHLPNELSDVLLDRPAKFGFNNADTVFFFGERNGFYSGSVYLNEKNEIVVSWVNTLRKRINKRYPNIFSENYHPENDMLISKK